MFLGNIFGSLAAYQKSLSIDSVRSAGDKCNVVFSLDNCNILSVLGLDYLNLIDLVCKNFIEDMNIKFITLNQLVKVCEKCRRRQSSVTSQNCRETEIL